MSEQYSNHRDTPLRRFNTFWWGLAYFGFFGLVSAIVYLSAENPLGVEDLRKADRMEMRNKVDKDQAKLMEGMNMEGAAAKAVKPEKASDMLLPNAASTNEAPAWASDPEMIAKGKAVYPAKSCATCHGPDGTQPTAPIYPSLADKDASYLLKKMQDIKSGAYTSQMTPMMMPFISQCSDEDMKAIAAWLSSKK